MSSAGNCCVVLAVGLVFLSLCSTGQALQCYNCNNWSTLKCEANTNCASPNNACMRITLPDGSSKYGCRAYDQCTHDIISKEFSLQNFELKCCQKDLCNSSVVVYPSIVLLLSLAAALLMMSS